MNTSYHETDVGFVPFLQLTIESVYNNIFIRSTKCTKRLRHRLLKNREQRDNSSLTKRKCYTHFLYCTTHTTTLCVIISHPTLLDSGFQRYPKNT